MDTQSSSASKPTIANPAGVQSSTTWIQGGLAGFRKRIIAGILLLMPFVVTFWIVFWLFKLLEGYVISPAAWLVVYLLENQAGKTELPDWYVNYVAPIIGMIGVIVLLYFLGAFARSRLAGLIDKLLLHLPVIKSVHQSVIRIFQSLKGEELTRYKRVVLVSFPHPGMRVPAFVTSTCRDVATQKTILCVYVPTTPVPTSGYMILIPEEEVTELDWGLEETLQAVVSFGMTAPNHVRYYPTAH